MTDKYQRPNLSPRSRVYWWYETGLISRAACNEMLDRLPPVSPMEGHTADEVRIVIQDDDRRFDWALNMNGYPLVPPTVPGQWTEDADADQRHTS